jgi:hypothetical protein
MMPSHLHLLNSFIEERTGMRLAFEQWALRNGNSIRRREDRPDQYLLSETEQRWQIWQTALKYGRGRGKPAPAEHTSGEPAALRDGVLDDVLDVCARMDRNVDIGLLMATIAALRRPAMPNRRDAESGR